MERFDARHNDLDDARGLLLGHAGHHLTAEHKHHEEDDETQHKAYSHLDFEESVLAGFEVFGVDLNLGGVDLVEFLLGYAVNVLQDDGADVALELLGDVALEVGRGHLAFVVEEGIAGDGCLASGYVEDRRHRVFFFQAPLGVIDAAGILVGNLLGRLEGAVEELGVINDQHGGLLVWAQRQIDRDGIKAGQQQGHYDGEYPERFFLDSRKIFAANYQKYLSH